MKKSVKEELRSKSKEELLVEIKTSHQELFSVRSNRYDNVPAKGSPRLIRKKIACIKTILSGHAK